MWARKGGRLVRDRSPAMQDTESDIDSSTALSVDDSEAMDEETLQEMLAIDGLDDEEVSASELEEIAAPSNDGDHSPDVEEIPPGSAADDNPSADEEIAAENTNSEEAPSSAEDPGEHHQVIRSSDDDPDVIFISDDGGHGDDGGLAADGIGADAADRNTDDDDDGSDGDEHGSDTQESSDEPSADSSWEPSGEDSEEDDTDDEPAIDAPPVMRPARRRAQPVQPARNPAPRGRGRPRRQPLQPNSDNDPSEPDSDASLDDAPAVDNWARGYRRVRQHRFRGPLGPAFDATGFKERDFFHQFFPLSLIIKMVTWTNISLAAAGKALTTIEELRAWIGILFVMGLTRVKNYADYWGSMPGFRNTLIAGTMRLKRFQQLSSHLACADPDTNPENWPVETSEERKGRREYMRSHPTYPVRKMWKKVVKNCRRKYHPGRQLSLDEAMIRYKGHKSAAKKIFMPTKPIRNGFKVYALCDAVSGFMVNFVLHITSEKKRTVLDIAMKVARPFLQLYHHIFTDKYYTSVPLAETLLQQRTYLTGAIKTNSRGLPNDLSPNPRRNPNRWQSIKNMKRTPRGTIYIRQKDRLTYVLWRDTDVISLLSSAHNPWRNKNIDIIRRNLQRQGRHARFVAAPRQAISYNSFMGGVDLSDQLRSYFTCQRKAEKWWKQLLFFLLDIAAVNAWVIYQESRDIPNNEKMTRHGHFQMRLAEQLIDGYSEATATQQRRLRRARQNNEAVPVPLANGPAHLLVKMHPTADGKKCAMCQRLGLHRPSRKKSGQWALISSRYGCMACNVHLCRGPKDCFARYVWRSCHEEITRCST